MISHQSWCLLGESCTVRKAPTDKSLSNVMKFLWLLNSTVNEVDIMPHFAFNYLLMSMLWFSSLYCETNNTSFRTQAFLQAPKNHRDSHCPASNAQWARPPRGRAHVQRDHRETAWEANHQSWRKRKSQPCFKGPASLGCCLSMEQGCKAAGCFQDFEKEPAMPWKESRDSVVSPSRQHH